MKIAIIGTGMVGSTLAYTLTLSGIFEELLLIDVNKSRANAEALDISHSATFTQSTKIISGDYSDLKNTDIIVITAGANQKKGEKRIDLLTQNVKIFKEILPNIKKHLNNSPFTIIASNPVDIMTEITLNLLDSTPSKIIGTGTILDSARFKYELGLFLNISPLSIQANVIGEHGDTEVLLWSSILANSTHFERLSKSLGKKLDSQNRKNIDTAVRNSAYEIIKGKGSTYYGIASSIQHIINSILSNNNTILNICSHHSNSAGSLSYSLPTIINKDGIIKSLIPNMNEIERKDLLTSINTLAIQTQTALSLLK